MCVTKDLSFSSYVASTLTTRIFSEILYSVSKKTHVVSLLVVLIRFSHFFKMFKRKVEKGDVQKAVKRESPLGTLIAN